MTPFKRISYLTIEVNSACNLKCLHCNREELVSKGWREKKILTKSELKKRLDVLKDCPIDTIKLEGISEPMLHPEFDQMAALLKEHFPKAFVIIATNLIYNLEKVPFLKTLPFVDMVYLSIDGTNEVFETHRIGAKYSIFLKNLEKIQAQVSQKERSKKLHLNFTATMANYRCLPEVYNLKEKFGLASVRINLAQNWNEDQNNSHSFDSKFIEYMKKFAKDLKGVPQWQYQDCFWPHSGLTVDVFGDIRQCIINTSQNPITNILAPDFIESFNSSPHYTSVRDSLSRNMPPRSCLTCDYRHLGNILDKIFQGTPHANQARAK